MNTFKSLVFISLLSTLAAKCLPSRCPLATDRCTNGGISVLASSPSVFKCWIKVDGNWKCGTYQDGRCNPSINYIDVSKCNYNPPPPSNCPLATDRCTNGGISVLASSPSVFKCWIKVDGNWKCGTYQDGRCNPSINYTDVTKCGYGSTLSTSN